MKILNEWLPLIAWLVVVSSAKIAQISKTKKQTKTEVMIEIIFTFFGGILAFITLNEMSVKAYRWVIISAFALAGGETLKILSLGAVKASELISKNLTKKIK